MKHSTIHPMKLCLPLLTTLIFAACSSTPQVTEYPPTADPQQELAKVEDNIKQAQGRHGDVLAPDSMAKAREYVNKAKEFRDNNKDQKDVLYQIAVAEAYVTRANDVATMSEPTLQAVLVKRQDAINANAPQLLSEEFNATDDNLRLVGNDLEKNDLSTATKRRDALEAQYADLELNAIKKAKLSRAREDITAALREGAQDLTPATVDWAVKKVNADEATIANNLHNPVIVDNASADATAAGSRLLSMVRQAKTQTTKSPEELARSDEARRLNEMAAQARIDQEAAKAQALAAEGGELKEKLVYATKAEMAFAEAQKAFTPEEASVYRQGDKIIVRLNGLNFPKGSAEITPENYGLLAKVQQVTKGAGDNASIIVEGHTDSTGSAKVNNKLSQMRAQAVESYLVSNNAVTADRIKATGRGESAPLASNKTSEGRAQNRRVDVVIYSEGPGIATQPEQPEGVQE